MREKVLSKLKLHKTQKNMQRKSKRRSKKPHKGRRVDCESTVRVARWKVVKDL